MSFKSALALAATTLALAMPAAAAPVSFSQTQSMTSNGQDLAFSFAGLDASDGTGGTLTLVGNTLDLGSSIFEFMDVSIEGTGFGRWSCGGNGIGSSSIPGWTDSGSGNGSRCAFTLNIGISAAQLDGFLLDGTVNILAAMSFGVTVLGAPSDNLTATLSYNTAPPLAVPAPAGGALLLGGLFGLATLRRRRMDNRTAS